MTRIRLNMRPKNTTQLDRRSFLLASGMAGAGLLSVTPSVFGAALPQDKGLIVHTESPPNSEPPLEELVKKWMTPTELFYVRSHAPTPKLDASSFRLTVEGMVGRELSFTLADLRNTFPKQSVIATMTCAGNRRTEHSLVKKVSGVPWQAGAIGNAQWGGVRLSDILKKAGVREGAKHVWFEGVDEIQRTSGVIPFGASIPLEKAMQDTDAAPGAMVAFEMNNKPLTPDHGFPMRTVVPGYIGARSVKWLGKIVVSDRPSTNHYVATAYKLVTEGRPDEWAAAEPIGEYLINSVTCLPGASAAVKGGQLTVSGYALPPGDPKRTVSRVEVSTDDGKTWTKARFTSEARPLCWRLWTTRITVKAGTKRITVRAIDSTGAVQPESVDWNLKGYLFNAWHRTPISVRG